MPALPALGTVGALGATTGAGPGTVPEPGTAARGESRFARLLGARKSGAEPPPATATATAARPTVPRSGALAADNADAQTVATAEAQAAAAADAQAAAAADPALAAQLALANPPRDGADAAATTVMAVAVPAGIVEVGPDQGTPAGTTEDRAAPARVGDATSPAAPPASGHAAAPRVGNATIPAAPTASGRAAAPQAAIGQESTPGAAAPGAAWSQALATAAQATSGTAPGAARPATAAQDPAAANLAALSAAPAGPAAADMPAAASAEARAVLRAALPAPAGNDAAAAAAAVPAAGQPARDVADLAAPALPVGLATPIDEPDFAAHLGAQVSLLALGGVHKAELRLNPEHMGPVAVHIALDGTQARVEFGVDVPATRQAIEDGLPALAAALREAGFTLSGGGVSQHPQGQARREAGQSGGDARPWPGRSGGDEAIGGTAALPAAVRRVSLGHLDLYA